MLDLTECRTFDRALWRSLLTWALCAATLALGNGCGGDEDCKGNEEGRHEPLCDCPDTGDCNVECVGDNCDLECTGSGSCDLMCGTNCDIQCTGTGDCVLDLEHNSSVVCSGSGNCDILCRGSCVIYCTGTGSCTAQCGVSANVELVDGQTHMCEGD